MSTDLKSNQILANLKSSDPEFVLETIENIRESGNPLILEGLCDLLHETPFHEIKKSNRDKKLSFFLQPIWNFFDILLTEIVSFDLSNILQF